MLKLLFFMMTLPIIFCSQVCSLPDCFCEAITIKGYNNGQEIVIESEVEEKTIEDLFLEAIKDSRDMPAYGVSLHKETIKAMKEGVWLEFKFAGTMEFNELPFDSLLIHIEKDTGGVNLIRGINGIYDGRCFYLDLEHNFNDLYDYLVSLDTRELLPEEDLEVELESQTPDSPEIQTSDDEGEGASDDDGDDEATSAEIPSVPKNNDDKPKVI